MRGENDMSEKSVRLLLTAGLLMLISGCLFGFIGQWIYAALIWVGAFGCGIGVLNLKNRNIKEFTSEDEVEQKIDVRGDRK